MAIGMRLVASHGYPDGAPPGFSGGFKEESCHACHFSSDPNSSPGRVAIDGVPAQFAAGEKYTLTVTLSRPGMKRGGFQLAARFKDNGAQAGTLAPGSADTSRVGVELQSGIQYANQKKDGSSVEAPDMTRWTIEWTAPAGSGPVVFLPLGERGRWRRQRERGLRLHHVRGIGAASLAVRPRRCQR